MCRLLERTNQRPAIFKNYLRHYPTLSHPALAHSPLLTSQLGNIVEKRKGLTFVTAETAIERAFLAYAFAHESEIAANMRATAFGVSAYGHDVFVPFSGLLALQSLELQSRSHQLAQFVSEAARALTAPVVFIDVSGSNPGLISGFLAKASSRHIIIADVEDAITKLSHGVAEEAHLVSASPASTHRLSAEIKTLNGRDR
jgi:hypothetical protein